MGVVYKARDPRLNRAVAVKVLRAAVDADGDRHRRFMHEAKAASALNHPNIVTVYDVDRAHDIDFIVMEYVAGRTLEDRIGTRGIGLRDTVKYLTQVADALSAAHSAGIVHRDLKPANIMIGDNDVVKLLDFGIAKLIEPPAVAASAPTMTAGPSVTGQGIVIGTSAYASRTHARPGAAGAVQRGCRRPTTKQPDMAGDLPWARRGADRRARLVALLPCTRDAGGDATGRSPLNAI